MSSTELTQQANEAIVSDSLRLLSITEVRQLLKVRHETVRKLIEDGKIEVIIIGKRIKIPIRSVEKFIEENARVITDEQKEERLSISRGYFNDHVDSIINKHIRRK